MRATAYVDGLNLYHGMEGADLKKYRWLDVHKLCEQLAVDAGGRLGKPVKLETVVYCTSLVTSRNARRRQDLYLQALEVHRPQMVIVHGKYEEKGRDCKCECGCHNLVTFQKEKRTDVNLAVAMLTDSALPIESRPEVQILVTGDSDLRPAITASHSSGVKVVVAYPPARARVDVSDIADAWIRISRRHLRNSPLPSELFAPNGYPIPMPDGWDHPDSW
jgi:uncharacterized LabA/DUF88 family protein